VNISAIIYFILLLELVALCRLIGPLGVTFIQERLLVILEQLTRDASVRFCLMDFPMINEQDIVAMNLEALQTLHKVMELRTEKLKRTFPYYY
jgi:hypothetical protein